MNITRRHAIRNCFIISIGAAMIPACMQEKAKPLVSLKFLQLDGNQQKLVAEVCETIIPKTDTPGAKDTFTDLFVLKMLDDCTTKKQQEHFVKGMNSFNELSKKKFNISFVDCTTEQRTGVLKALIDEKGKEEAGSAADFYKTMKKLTLQGYMTSKYYLTNVQVYKLVPGKFSGCIPVTKMTEKGGSI